jgi:hypothetical protein
VPAGISCVSQIVRCSLSTVLTAAHVPLTAWTTAPGCSWCSTPTTTEGWECGIHHLFAWVRRGHPLSPPAKLDRPLPAGFKAMDRSKDASKRGFTGPADVFGNLDTIGLEL